MNDYNNNVDLHLGTSVNKFDYVEYPSITDVGIATYSHSALPPNVGSYYANNFAHLTPLSNIKGHETRDIASFAIGTLESRGRAPNQFSHGVSHFVHPHYNEFVNEGRDQINQYSYHPELKRERELTDTMHLNITDETPMTSRLPLPAPNYPDVPLTYLNNLYFGSFQ